VNHPEQEIVDQKTSRAAAINALRNIAKIVASEIQADMEKLRVLRWFAAMSGCCCWGGSVAGLWHRHNLEG